MTEKLATQKEYAMTPFDDLGSIEGVQERPQSIDPHDRTGKEDIGADEIRLPRLVVAQGLHPQLVPGETKYIKGLVIGQMFNNLTEEVYGNGPLTLVPVYRFVTRIQFDAQDRKVVVDREVPPGDPRLRWRRGAGQDGKDLPPEATQFIEFISLLLRPGKEPERVIVTIKTTNKEMREAAELWTTYIDNRSGPIYSGMYRISSQMVKGKSMRTGQDTLYGVFVIKQAGYIPTDTPGGKVLFDYAKQFNEAAKDKRPVADYIDADVDESSSEFDVDAMEAQARAEAERAVKSDM